MFVKTDSMSWPDVCERLEWAQRYCSSYINISAEARDPSKLFSPPWEHVAIFQFGNPKDATLFRLKWS